MHVCRAWVHVCRAWGQGDLRVCLTGDVVGQGRVCGSGEEVGCVFGACGDWWLCGHGGRGGVWDGECCRAGACVWRWGVCGGGCFFGVRVDVVGALRVLALIDTCSGVEMCVGMGVCVWGRGGGGGFNLYMCCSCVCLPRACVMCACPPPLLGCPSSPPILLQVALASAWFEAVVHLAANVSLLTVLGCVPPCLFARGPPARV